MSIAARLLGTVTTTASAGLEDDSSMMTGNADVRIAGLESAVGIAASSEELQTINRDFDDIDRLGNIQSRLTTTISRLSSITFDGMSRREAQFVADDAEAIHSEIGINGLINLPGIEHFGAAIDAKSHTEAAIEAEDGALAKVWKWIVDMMKKLKDIIASWWDKFFGEVEKLLKYAEKVKAAAAKYKEEKDNKKVSIEGKLLYKGETKPTDATIPTEMSDFAKSAAWLTVYATKAESLCDAVTGAMEDADPVEATLAANAKKVSAAAKDLFSGVASAAGIPAADDTYIGGQYLIFKKAGDESTIAGAKDDKVVAGLEEETQEEEAARIAKEKADAEKLAAGKTSDRADGYTKLNKTVFKLKGADSKKAASTLEINRLSKDGVITVADAVIDICKELMDMKKSRQDARKYADKATKAASDLEKKSAGLDSSESKFKPEMVALGKVGVMALSEVTAGVIAGWTSHMVKVSNAALKVAAASI